MVESLLNSRLTESFTLTNAELACNCHWDRLVLFRHFIHSGTCSILCWSFTTSCVSFSKAAKFLNVYWFEYTHDLKTLDPHTDLVCQESDIQLNIFTMQMCCIAHDKYFTKPHILLKFKKYNQKRDCRLLV